VKRIANSLRNVWMFKIRYPWIKIGRDVHCQLSTSFWAPRRRIVIGDHVGIGYRCIFMCDIEIGSKVLIASSVAFINSDDHLYNKIGRAMWDSGRGDRYHIIVEDDVWIGHGATILTPAVVGRGAIVGAGSVVVKDVPRYAIVGGIPARVLNMRFSPDQVAEHERIVYGASDAVHILT